MISSYQICKCSGCGRRAVIAIEVYDQWAGFYCSWHAQQKLAEIKLFYRNHKDRGVDRYRADELILSPFETESFPVHDGLADILKNKKILG